MRKLFLPMHLQFFSEEIPSEPVEITEPVETPSEGVEDVEIAEPQTEDAPETPTDEPEIDKSKAFAARLKERTDKILAEERSKWEQEQQEKYGQHDQYRKAAEYLQQTSGFSSIQELQEAIELQELQERAESQNVSPEVLKRIDELEQKAQKADLYEQQQAEQQAFQAFRSDLEKFAQEKGADANELHQFMYDNDLGNMDIAYRAMKAEQLEQQLESAKKDAVKEYLESKKAPKVESTGTAGITYSEPPKTFEEARARAAEMIRAANQT
jgi:hypothetical protein